MFNINALNKLLLMRQVKITAISLLMSFMLCPGFSLGQTENEVNKAPRFDPLVDNIADKLPPLEILIDSAVKHAPSVRIIDAEISIMRYNLKDAKIDWTKNFAIQGQFTTGNTYQFYTNQSVGNNPSEFATDSYEYYYNFGAFVRIPINELLNHKSKINIAKREIEKNLLFKEEKAMSIRKEVIMVYQDLLMRQELLKIRNEAQLTSRMQVQLAEIEFTNGTLSLAEYSKVIDYNTKNLCENREETFLFYKQYLILEELVGMKFNLLSEIE